LPQQSRPPLDQLQQNVETATEAAAPQPQQQQAQEAPFEQPVSAEPARQTDTMAALEQARALGAGQAAPQGTPPTQ
jgi:hypothetical protein